MSGEVRDCLGGSVSAVGRTKGVVDVELSGTEKLFCKARIVFLFLRMKPDIFQEQNLPRSEGSADFFGFGSDAVRCEKNGASEQLTEVSDNGSKGIFFYGLPFGATEVARKDKGGTFL